MNYNINKIGTWAATCSFAATLSFVVVQMLQLLGLLILRGMGLGIPYLNPEMNAEKHEVHGCCSKDQ